ncbi:MAG: nucleotidyltransferase family protein [Mycobacterium sp.]
MTSTRVTGVVLAAGSSRRLGQPKQLLPYRNSTLLGETLRMARGCGFDQLIVTLGGAADQVRQAVPLDGLQTVEVDDPGSGCSGSLRVAVGQVDEGSAGIVLMLGDQPGVVSETIHRVIDEGSDHQIAVCRYDDNIGHPFWMSRTMFDEISLLHGDKGVWKLIESGRFDVAEVRVAGTVPQDVDTWDDYERLLAVAQ